MKEIKKNATITVEQSVLEDFTKIAFVQRSSVSKIIVSFMKMYVQKNKDQIKKYNDFFDEKND